MRRTRPRDLQLLRRRRERQVLDRVALQPQRWAKRSNVRLVDRGPYDWSRGPGP